MLFGGELLFSDHPVFRHVPMRRGVETSKRHQRVSLPITINVAPRLWWWLLKLFCSRYNQNLSTIRSMSYRRKIRNIYGTWVDCNVPQPAVIWLSCEPKRQRTDHAVLQCRDHQAGTHYLNRSLTQPRHSTIPTQTENVAVSFGIRAWFDCELVTVYAVKCTNWTELSWWWQVRHLSP